MPTLTEKEKDLLLRLARTTIAAELNRPTTMEDPQDVSQNLMEKRGCFVSLHKKGILRGCIGRLEPVDPLISTVEENAKHAAFRDPRFPALTADELSEVEIEISILTIPKALTYRDGEDLKSQLEPGVHGVILSKGGHRATFLPQVWDQLPSKEDFLGQLCIKGGLKRNCWKEEKPTVEVYEAEYFSE
jgi:AmmeMemoRadiSam system protein A